MSDLSPLQAIGFVTLFIGLVAKYYGTRALEILDRIPKQEWFKKVDLTMDEVLKHGERIQQQRESLEAGRQRMATQEIKIRDIELRIRDSEAPR